MIQLKKEKEITAALQDFFAGCKTDIIYDSYEETLEVHLTLETGKVLKIRGGQCSGRIEIFVPAPPEKVQRHELSGTLLRTPFKELFDDNYSAEKRLREIGTKINCDEDAALTIKEVTVEI